MNWQKLLLLSCCLVLFGALAAQPLVIDLGPDVSICEGESFTLQSTVSGGDGNYTYEWSPSAGLSCADCPNPTFAGIGGTYQLTVEDGAGEMETASIVITSIPIPVIVAQATTVTCAGSSDGVISVNVSGGSFPVAYVWSNGSTAPTIQGLVSGTYCVTVVNDEGCEASDCFIIDEPSPMNLDIQGPTTIDCPNEDVTYTAMISGGTAPFTFTWQIDGAVVATTQDLQVIGQDLNNIFIDVTVTDANGCTLQAGFTPEISLTAAAADGELVFIDCISETATLDASPSSEGPNISYEWSGPDNFSSDQAIVEVNQTGNYTLRVTNTAFSDCFVETTVEVADYNDILGIELDPVLTACNTYELSYVSPINIPTLQQIWTFPDGSTQMGTTITATETGLYLLTLDLGTGNCAFTESVFIDAQASACATINGHIRWDQDEFCLIDPNDPPLGGWLVTASGAGGSFSTITDDNGFYEFYVPVGEYTVVPFPPSQAWEGCWDVGNVNALVEGGVATFDFIYTQLVSCPELAVSLSTPLLRRCFNSWYYVSICNIGTETAFAPEATLVLDDFLSFVASEEPGAVVDGQMINWTLGALEPGDCHEFWVRVLVSCDADLGQVHCSELFVTPDVLCVSTNPDWSGANLEVTGECDGNMVNFRVRNTGEGDLADPVQYIIIEDGVVLMDEPGLLDMLSVDNEEVYPVDANGSTYTFEIAQAPDHPYTTSVSISVEGCGTNEQGGFSTGFVTQFAQQTAAPTSAISCLENVGSYDPNDKGALPVGYGDQHYIVPETEINYRIRFQNTGTDTAFTVVIRDTLADELDLTSFRPGTASHDYELDIAGERTLIFTFNNILLPDSTTNLEASQGFVDFKISPDLSTPLETVIENEAAIYFDFNDPIVTNTVFHTLGRDFLEVVEWIDLSDAIVGVTAFPNPAYERLQINIEGELTGNKHLLLVDAAGRTVLEHIFEGNTTKINLEAVPTGWYSMQLLDGTGTIIGTGKLVKQ